MSTHNSVPTAAGLASSASGFAALCLAATHAAGLTLSADELSALARRGSGSAARSIHGGFVEMFPGQRSDGADALARPLLAPEAWDVRLVVAVTARGPKAIGSTAAMDRTAATSPFYDAWVASVARDLADARAAIAARDLHRLGPVVERSALRMHASAMAAEPGILYWRPATLAAIRVVQEAREAGGPVGYFTMDAGPHVKVLCQAADAAALAARLQAGARRGAHPDRPPGPGGRGPGGRVKPGRATLKGSPLVLAPGKLFLAGEYAVLEGGVAVVAAASRYALAQFQPQMAPTSALVAEATARARAALGDVAAAVPEGAAQVSTDTFFLEGVKLGLGSSAAAAVAAAGALLEYAGVSLAVNRELLFSVADAAHRASQGGVGSGADIATAVYGGFVRFVRLPDSAPVISRILPPPDLHVVVFWTRTAARTAQLVTEVRAFAERAPQGYAERMGALRAAAGAFAEAFTAHDARGVVRWADACHRSLADLGEAADLPIVTPEVARAAELARHFGGAAKPSGAGGGDLGVAFFSEARAAHTFVARCPEELLVLDLQLGATGAYRRLPSGVETFKKD